jgi:uncharacterized NAD-dependent epimerase/dehydratase family protein
MSAAVYKVAELQITGDYRLKRVVSKTASCLIATTRRHAVVYAEDGADSLLGKTAHGVLRLTSRYIVDVVIDSVALTTGITKCRSGEQDVPIVASVEAAFAAAPEADVLVIGIAPTGFGHLANVRVAVLYAVSRGVAIHSGLHYYFSEDEEVRTVALASGAEIVDIRKPPPRPLRMFTGEIERVRSPRLLVTGQDAAVGKRTTALRLALALSERLRVALIGTGQTAWLQGFRYGVRLDALPMDFAGGELEAEILRADSEEAPDLIIVEGQGSLLNPGYSAETMILLTAARPKLLVYVACPAREVYVDYPQYPIRSASEEMNLLLMITGGRMVGTVINDKGGVDALCGGWAAPVVVGAYGDLNPIVSEVLVRIQAGT